MDARHRRIAQPVLGVDPVAEAGDLEQPLDLGDATGLRHVGDEQAGRVRADVDRADPAGHRRAIRLSASSTVPTPLTDEVSTSSPASDVLEPLERRLHPRHLVVQLGRALAEHAEPLALEHGEPALDRGLGGAHPPVGAQAADERVREARSHDHHPHDHRHQHHRRDLRASAKVFGRDAGWSSPVARRAHNPKVAGSNPAPAIATLVRPPPGGRSISRRSVGPAERARETSTSRSRSWRWRRSCLCGGARPEPGPQRSG